MTAMPENRETRSDASQQPFVEVATLDGEAVRVTWIPEDPAAPGWAGEPRVRINKVQANGHVVPGPEVPRSRMPDFVRGLVQLMLDSETGAQPR
jgi:hypothetical protein